MPIVTLTSDCTIINRVIYFDRGIQHAYFISYRRFYMSQEVVSRFELLNLSQKQRKV